MKAVGAILALLILSGCNRQSNKGQNSIEVIYEHDADTAKAPVSDSSDSTFTDTAQAQNETILSHKPLTLIIKNLASSSAPVIVSIYGVKNKFLDEFDLLKKYKFLPDGRDLKAQISDLDYGELAFASFQDLNEDGKINRNPLGWPKEPFCFSNNYKPKVRAPKFNECNFYYNDSANVVVSTMIR